MKHTQGVLAAAMALVLSGSMGSNVWAQAKPPLVESSAGSTQTYYLKNNTQPNDASDIVSALRNLLDPGSKIYLIVAQSAIVVQTTPEQQALAVKLLHDIDRPKSIYHLTYTITESDGGKRIGVQHFSELVASGGRTTTKQGSKIPIITGTYTAGATAQQQATYLDVGINIDASVDELATGVRLKSKIEQSSVAEERSAVGAQDPVIRQTVIEGTSILTVGKPQILGSVDVAGSTRHLDVEVVLEPVK